MVEENPTSEDGATPSGDPLISRISFNSDDYPESERGAAYQTIVGGPASLTPLGGPFYARITGFIAGPLRFHYIEAVPHRFERALLKIAMDSADYLVIQHLIEGEVEGDCAGKTLSAPEGSVYCLNFRQPSLLIEKRPTRLHFVTVSRQVASDRFGDLRVLHGALFSHARAASYIGLLEQIYPRLAETRRSEIGGLVSKTLSELEKLFAGVAPPNAEGLLQRAKGHISSRLGSRDLTPENIAEELGVSRSQLYVMFRECGGVSKYIWGQRLHHVHAALLAPRDSRTLTELAMDFGFTSQSHLSSLFRKVYGEPPSRVRQSRQTG